MQGNSCQGRPLAILREKGKEYCYAVAISGNSVQTSAGGCSAIHMGGGAQRVWLQHHGVHARGSTIRVGTGRKPAQATDRLDSEFSGDRKRLCLARKRHFRGR